MAQPVRADAQRQTLTIEYLTASVGKRPKPGLGYIADTYYSDEEFLAALDAPPSSDSKFACVGIPDAHARQSDDAVSRATTLSARLGTG